MVEKELQRKVNEFLRKANVFFYHPREGKKGTDGVPDVVGCCNSFFFAIELKSDRYKDARKGLRKEQINMIERIRENGGFVLITNNFDEVVEFINKLKRLKCRSLLKK
ncbi:MAG: hypothetical protein ABDI07_11685, partial [Candidatus Kryptonium sp.]